MSDSVYYHQGCPVCGRMLRIGVRLLGQRVYCQHCGGGFRATDETLEEDEGALRAVGKIQLVLRYHRYLSSDTKEAKQDRC